MNHFLFYFVLTVLMSLGVIVYLYLSKVRVTMGNKFLTVIEVAVREQKISAESAIYLTHLYELRDQDLNCIANKLRCKMAIKALKALQRESSDKEQ